MESDQYALMDAAEDGMWWYRALHARILAAIGPIPAGAGVLDAGCGTGGFLAALGTGDAVGLEFHPAAAGRARAKSAAAIAAGTVNAMPFPDRRFGVVVSLDVLSHAAVDPPTAAGEMFRVLAPGGRFVVNLPAFEWLRSAHDARVHNARRFTARTARALLEAAGFTGIRAGYWNTLLLPLMAAHRKLGARAPDARSDVAAFPPWLDRTLLTVTRVEHAIQRTGIGFPAGGSLLLTASRPLTGNS